MNKVSTLLNKTKDSVVASIIYQVLLLTNDSVARVVLMSMLLNIRKKCQPAQLPAIISQFSFALKSNTVCLHHSSNAQLLCKVFLEVMKSAVLPPTVYSLLILLSLSDTEVLLPSPPHRRSTAIPSGPCFSLASSRSFIRPPCTVNTRSHNAKTVPCSM